MTGTPGSHSSPPDEILLLAGQLLGVVVQGQEAFLCGQVGSAVGKPTGGGAPGPIDELSGVREVGCGDREWAQRRQDLDRDVG
jgi:hypothetical protein